MGPLQRLGLPQAGLLVAAIVWTSVSASNVTKPNCTTKAKPCQKGIILPVWQPPSEEISFGEVLGRSAVYFLCLCYMFLGVSIIADRFMAAIEVITSKERAVKLRRVTGEEYTVLVRVWNETVSNLTLMALGSSAPEILLSVIEIVGNNFTAGELGPGTIVGSAAFNLFIIIGVCIGVIKTPEIRRVKHIYVFWVTSLWAIFAYIWLFLILKVISPLQVDVWEGVLTFLFFPLTVLTAYAADRQMFGLLGRRFMEGKRPQSAFSNTAFAKGSDHSSETAAFEAHRAHYIEIFKRLRAEHPGAPIGTLERLAEEEAILSAPKSRAFYRIQATRKLVGAGDIASRKNIEDALRKSDTRDAMDGAPGTSDTHLGPSASIYFDPGTYTVMEDVGIAQLTVVCDRRGVSQPAVLQVDYRTEDGTAHAKSDYVSTSGTLTFQPGEQRKNIGVEIIDNDIYEEDEEFTVKLSNPRLLHQTEVSVRGGTRVQPQAVSVSLGAPHSATVLIIDNDHAGAFEFEHGQYDVSEADGYVELNVTRTRGARGMVVIPYKTVEGTAKAHKDFEPLDGQLHFKDEQTSSKITVRIICDDDYEKTEDFYVTLGDPIWNGVPGEKDASGDDGSPILGTNAKTKVQIKESKEFKSFVDKMLAKTNANIVVGSSSWKQQFKDALTVRPADEDEDDTSEPLSPSVFEYVMHGLTLPWCQSQTL